MLHLLLALAALQNPVERLGDAGALRKPPPAPFAGRPFALDAGDVVVFVGQANMVQTAQNGELEALLASAAKPRFRNMAWEGDTVYEQWRDINFRDWQAQLAAVEATTIVAWFGQMEALDGPARLAEFAAAYGRLLDQFAAITRRVVLISPLPFEKPASPHVPDLSRRNDDVKAYAEAVRKLAEGRGAIFVSLSAAPTSNGMHLTDEGRRTAARRIAESLGAPAKSLDALEPLRREIVEKNRLWFDCWRTMNWAFAYSDRTTQPFAKPAGGKPSLVQELLQYKPLIQAADARIHALAAGEAVPPRPTTPAPAPVAALTPEEQLASFTVLDGYEANLFASEADGIVKPVQIRWDERGRLWVACIPTYPHIEPGAKPADYILVCEDTDNDGRADKFIRFAEGLFMPMGIEFGDGGVYVCESTQLVHFRDTDGDGKADVRRVILSGFGTGDAHQLINSLVWSPDGDLWFGQGLHVFSRVETPWGISRLERAAVWRFNPRRLQLHGFFNNATAGANTWGIAFDDWGQVFHDAGDTPHGYYTVPGMIPTLHPLPHPARMFVSRSKNTTLDFIGTRRLPEAWQGAAVLPVYYIGEVDLHRVLDDGSGFKSERIATLMKSSRGEFRPVDVRLGPDGAIYLCDWFNPIIGHYQASYRDPRRDKSHGRIWRVAAKGLPPVKPPALAAMSSAELLDQLRSPERWTRYQAKRLLFDRPDAIAALDAWSATDERLQFEALGVYQAHEAVRPDFLKKVLAARDPRARAYATRVVGRWADRLADPLALLRERAQDDHPRVRLEAVVASSYVASPHAIEVAALVLDRPRDKYIDYALTQAVHALKPQWTPALAAGTLTFHGRAAHLAFVLQADGTKDVAGFLRRAAPGQENLLALLADVGGADDMKFAFEQGATSVRVLDALSAAARLRGVQPAGVSLDRLIESEAPPLRAAAIRLAGAWRLQPLAARIRAFAHDAALPVEIRRAAIEALPRLGGSIADLCDVRELRAASIAAMVDLDPVHAARRAAEILPALKTQEEVAEVITPFLLRQGGTEALSKLALPADAAKLVARVLSSAGREAVGVRAARPEHSAEFVAQLAVEVKAEGDARRGRDVYRSELANCAACHRIDGQGGVTGPDLSAISRGAPLEHLIESVLWPKRQVKEGYLTVLVLTEDGGLYQGQKVRETADELVLRDLAAEREIRVSKARIKQLKDAGTAMPDGLTDGLTRAELRDLIRYLSDLGR